MATKKEVQQVFEMLGIEYSVNTFNDRIKLHKIVYLTQEAFDVNLDFEFTWYLYGPYSPDLTRTMFEKEPGTSSKIKENRKAELNLQKASKFFLAIDRSRDNLELLGSLHYVLRLSKKGNMSDERAKERFLELKPQFNKKEISDAYNIIAPFV